MELLASHLRVQKPRVRLASASRESSRGQRTICERIKLNILRTARCSNTFQCHYLPCRYGTLVTANSFPILHPAAFYKREVDPKPRPKMTSGSA